MFVIDNRNDNFNMNFQESCFLAVIHDSFCFNGPVLVVGELIHEISCITGSMTILFKSFNLDPESIIYTEVFL